MARAALIRDIEDAAARIRPLVPETPLVRNEPLSRALGCELWFKCELWHPTFSFKLRGAANDLLRAREDGRLAREGAEIVCSSSGNHGLACAWLARRLDARCHVFVSKQVGPGKRGVIAAMGGTVHRTGREIDDAREAAIAFAARHGHYFVNDGVSLEILAGAGTAAHEALRRLRDIDEVIAPIGGGNLAAGTALAVKALSPKTRVIGIAPTASPVIVESWRAGKMLSIAPGDTIADGLTQREPIAETMAVLWKHMDEGWLVEDASILGAMHALLESAHMLVEPSGAAGLAALWEHRGELVGRRVVVLLTGSNVGMEQIRRALAAPSLAPLG